MSTMRLYHSPRARRAASSHGQAYWRLPLLERLEERVVPSIADGTILVTTSPSSYASENQSGFPTGILGVNPSTGAQNVVSTGGLFSLPTYIAEAPNQELYVTDLTAFGSGAVFRVDPNTGQQSLVAKGAMINGPNALAFINGFLYVANVGDSSGTIHTLVKIDPNTGQQTLATNGSGGGFTVADGMVPAPGNNVYVADEPGNFQSSDPGKIWEVNLDTGQQTIISSNNAAQGMLFDHPVDLALDASGNIIVANTGGPADNVAGSVFRIDPKTGVQTLITRFGTYSGTDSVEVGQDGTIFVGAIANGPAPGQIIAVNPVTGIQSILSTGGGLSLVEGIRAFHATVPMAATTITLVSSANTSAFGQSVTFTATVTPSTPASSTPTGTVQFVIDGNNAGSPVSVNTSGGATTASFSIASLTVGTHTVTASYSGDASFAASNGTLPGGQTVSKASTSTALTASVNPSLSGQLVTFTATISVTAPGGGTPTGTVQFVIDGSNAGSPVNVNTSGGMITASFSTAGLAVGTHTVSAGYSGDGSFAGSNGSLSGGQMIIEPAPAATTITVNSSANPSVFGQSVIFTATVGVPSPGTGMPSGTVQFVIDGSNAGNRVTVSTNGGLTTASFGTAGLAVGTHTVSAGYSGDGSFAGSNGSLSGGQVVNPAATTTTVSSSANSSVFGQSVIFIATVSVLSPGTGTPSGTVQFVIDGSNAGTVLGTGLDATGTATFVTSALSVGRHVITAVYSGDSNSTGSTSAALSQVVGTPNERFVAQVYLDLLQRSVDPAGLAGWTGALANGATRAQVVAAIEASQEYETDLVQSFYQLYLQRTGEDAGVRGWVAFLKAGGSVSQMHDLFIGSPEYFQTRGSGTNTGFLDAFYHDAFNRNVDPSGRASWGLILDQDLLSRADVAEAIFTSPEYRQDLVESFYEHFLHRPADQGGLNSFVGDLQTGTTEQSVLAGIVGSDEYFARV